MPAASPDGDVTGDGQVDTADVLIATRILLDQRPAGHFADFCQEQNIAIFAYGNLAGGFLSERWLEAPATPGGDEQGLAPR